VADEQGHLVARMQSESGYLEKTNKFKILAHPCNNAMPRPKPSAITGTAELNAMIERVAPAILALLADGVPRTKAAIIAALAGRHAEDDVALALVRLAVTGRVEQAGSRYTLGVAGERS
jgi:hypothetical protein